MTLSRRAVLGGGTVLTGVATLELRGHAPRARAAAPGTPPGTASDTALGTTIREATNVALAAHPATGRLAFDVANALWVLPAEGGTARRLTDDAEDATWPSFFPDGERLAFQSFRRGSYDLCAVDIASGRVERLTRGPQYDQDPSVSPDGRHIAYVSDADGTSAVWLLELATGRARPLVGTGDAHAYRAPTWHPDGGRLAYVAGETRIEGLELSSGTRRTLHTAEDGLAFRGTGYGPSGQLSYVTTGGPRTTLHVDGKPLTRQPEEPAPFPAAWLSAHDLVHGAEGEVRRRSTREPEAHRAVPFAARLEPPGTAPEIRQPVVLPERAPVRGLAGPVLSPDASAVCFRALGKLWVLRLGGEAQVAVADGSFACDPYWFPDGKSFVYCGDRGGVPQLWRHTLGDPASGERDERLTDLAGGAFAPSVSPGGDRVAFHDQEGATWVLDVAAGKAGEVAPPEVQPGRASWSPDGRRLAMAVTVPVSARENAGHNQILVVDTKTRKRATHAVAPHRSIATRGDDGPVWLPDGSAFLTVVDSLVHTVPIAADGSVTGAPAVLSERIADAVSVSADGDVLFLSLGELVLLPRSGKARAKEVAYTPPLTVRQRTAPGRTVVRAGRLWDGIAEGYRENVDITLDAGVITSVADARPGGPEPTVDASNDTVIPGLIDVHNHWHLRGRQWAGRQGPLWLAYGVTTSRSTGDPAYRMAETRESLHAGEAVGPRYLGSGEPLDGTRCHFGFMRCVSSAEQLDREIERIVALDYNIVKSYQRLPVRLERRLLDRMRAEGVPVVSHYLYPAVTTGLNGMEHTGGENRLGYSRTLSFAGGRTAEDTVQLLAGSSMWVSSTLLFANELFRDSTDLVTDERTTTLFPAWEYAALKEKVRQAEGPDNDLNTAWTQGDVDLLLRVHKAGGTVVTGTDAPLDDVGIGIHQNLRAMVKYGFTPRDALQTATRNAARALGAEGELGTLQQGARADLLVVDGDPLRDIVAAARIKRVFADGHAHRIPDLLAPYAATRSATATATTATAAAAAVRPNPLAGTGCCRPKPGATPHPHPHEEMT